MPTPASRSRSGSKTRLHGIRDRSLTSTNRTYTGGVIWSDGHTAHAPVDAFKPNAFGLVNTHGNVAELCRDLFSDYATVPRQGDGLRSSADASAAVIRGGSWEDRPSEARSACRRSIETAEKHGRIGLRPARRVE